MNPFIRAIPSPLVRFFAKPYVAGDSIQKAVDEAANLVQSRRLFSTLDLLAEDIDSDETVQRNVEAYEQLFELIDGDTRFTTDIERPTVSLKLSSYTTAPLEKGGDAAGAKSNAMHLVEAAAAKNIRLSVDMESRHWTDFTLKFLQEVAQVGHQHVGAVLQSRLHRSIDDARNLPEKMRTRVVIGIYNEPADVAVTEKRAMKDRLLEIARVLLERGHYVEFGTHDELYIRRFLDEVVGKHNIEKSQFEIQMLYGVPRDKLLKELTDDGYTARLYVPFALGWNMAISYLRRRLDEYPNMMFLVARNMLLKG